MDIEKIRISIGSAAVLGLVDAHFKDPPTTCYLMTYLEGHCIANCGFCPQARHSYSSTEKLSRINWPLFNIEDFLIKLKYIPPSKKFKRICIQTLNYKKNFENIKDIINEILKISNIPISIAIPPMSKENLIKLRSMGVQRVGIALDAANPEIFEKIKGKKINGPYEWDKHIQALDEALDIFPKGCVTTHIIIGLGETEKDVIELIEKLQKKNIFVSLFAFTPIKGTKLESIAQPDIMKFRRLQLGRCLIFDKNKSTKDFTFNLKFEIIKFNVNKIELNDIIENSNAFLTSGCPGCNRPYYTSRPSGPIYNFPRKLTQEEKREIYNKLEKYVF